MTKLAEMLVEEDVDFQRPPIEIKSLALESIVSHFGEENY